MQWWVILIIVYFGSALVYTVMSMIIRSWRLQKSGRPATYAEEMKELTSRLVEASRAVDQVLTEMADAHRRQETILRQQGERVETLSAAEKELQQRIESLKEVPLPVAEYFAELSRTAQQEQEKKKASRDYKLVIISAVLSAAFTAVIMVLFG